MARPMFSPRFRNTIAFQFSVALFAAAILPVGVSAQTAAGPLPVVATFSILGDLAREVAKDRARITALVGPNGDAHVYRATPADARTLKDARVVIINGLGFDGFMPRLIKGSGTRAEIVTATAGFTPAEITGEKPGGKTGGHDHGQVDPHAWQSIDAAKIYIANIRDGLIKADPAGEAVYRANAADYLATLTRLKSEIEAGFAKISPERRVIVTSHDALGYFAREFGFTIVAVQGVSTDNEPSAKDVARIIAFARTQKAHAIFIENMTNPRIMEEVARETGAKIGGTLFSDALSDANGPASSYIAMIRHNARVIREALED